MLTDLNTVLAIAEKKKCAIPAFNVYDMSTALGVLFAAEESDSCVILQMYSRLFSSYEAEFISPAIVAAARRSKVKAVFHLDHGANNAVVHRALRWGCSSVMRDASDLPFDQNVAALQNVVKIAHDLHVSVEGELGYVGLAKDGVSTEYTKVDEAVRFVDQTGVDALAILVGTAHGHYKQAPILALDRIADIHRATKAYLVLHGGSGVPDDQIKASIQAGIRKINFGTDVCCALLDEVRRTSADVIAVDLFMKEPTQSVKRFALSKIALLGAEGSND